MKKLNSNKLIKLLSLCLMQIFTLASTSCTILFNSHSSQKSQGTGSNTARTDGTVIYNTATDLDWDSHITITSDKFTDFKEGDFLIFSYQSDTQAEYHNLKIYSSDWTNLSAGTLTNASLSEGAFQATAPGGTVSYCPTSSEIQQIKQNGLIIHGYGMKLLSVAISSSSSQDSSQDGSGTDGQQQDNTPTTPLPKPQTPKDTPVAEHGALHVDGAYLYDSHNNRYQLYGMSTHGINFGEDFSRYLNSEALQTLRDDWNTNCIRIVLYPRDYNGYCNGGNQAELKQLMCSGIDAATKLGMYVLVDWHVHNYNPTDTKNEAVTFLSEISAKYAEYPNVLYEICNEPTNSNWDNAIKPYAEEVTAAIRKNSPDSIVIVGTNTWSQDIEDPAASPLSYKNIMYTFHFYADSHQDSFRSRVENAVKNGLPIFVTEFGTCDASGNGGFNREQSVKWFDLLDRYSISHCNCSLCNKNETASAILSSCGKTSGWTESDLSDSGKLVYEHFRTLTR